MEDIWDSRNNDPLYHASQEKDESNRNRSSMSRYELKIIREVEYLLGTASISHHTVVEAVPEDDQMPLFSHVRCGVLHRSYDSLLRCSDLYRRLTTGHGDQVKPAEIHSVKREIEDLQHWIDIRAGRIGICVTGKCDCPDRRALGVA